jgi:hypothetical protein
MRVFRQTTPRRRGKILVFLAILLPALMAFMALAVDLSLITAARAQLNTAADAGALAGAMKLADDIRVLNNPSFGQTPSFSPEITAAQAAAKATAQFNLVLNGAPVFLSNTNNSASGDIVVGYFDYKTHQWTPPPLGSGLSPNSVMVAGKRSTDHGGLVPGLFSRTWGYQGTTVNVSSIATSWDLPIGGFQPAGSNPSNSPNANLLPIVLDKTTWIEMMTQKDLSGNPAPTTDQYTFTPSNYNPPNNNGVSTGPDGIYETLLYPVSAGLPGNWGTINVGVSNNSTSTLSAQIQYGITPTQLATFPDSTIALDYSQTPPSITFSGNPGISAGIKSALTAIIGKPVTIPVYDTSGGNGNNAWYRVIAFQPCRILDVSFQGNPKYVIIQPCLVKDSTAIPITNSSQWPSGWKPEWGGVVKTHLTR